MVAEDEGFNNRSQYSFLVWNTSSCSYHTRHSAVSGEEYDLLFQEYEYNVNKLISALSHSDQQSIIPIIPNITFGLSLQSEINMIVMHWNQNYISLASYCKNLNKGGLLSVGKLDLLRSIVTNILALVSNIHDAGFLLQSMSMSTIFIDESNMNIKLLLLPTLCEYKASSSKTELDSLNWYLHDVVMSSDASDMLLGCMSETIQRTASLKSYVAYKKSFACDIYALGICWYQLSFGKIPPQELCARRKLNYSELASQLLCDLTHKSLAHELHTNLKNSSSESMKSLLSYVIDIGDSSLALSSNSELNAMFISVNCLICFQKEFVINAVFGGGESVPTSGHYSQLSATVQLNKWLYKISNEITRKGTLELNILTDKLLSFGSKAATNKCTADDLRIIIRDEFDIRMTTQDVEIWIRSLYCSALTIPYRKDVHSGDVVSLCANEALKYFCRLFSAISLLGAVQESLFVITKCILVNETVTTDLDGCNCYFDDFKNLSFCSPLSDFEYQRSSQISASIAAGMASSPDHFVDQILLRPLYESANNFLQEENSSSDDSTFTYVEKVITVLSCIEELFLLYATGDLNVSRIAGVPVPNTRVVDLKRVANLVSCGVDVKWVAEVSASQIIFELLHREVFPLIAMVTLRFQRSTRSRIVPQSKGGGSLDGVLSLGAHLLVRTSKFLQHMQFYLNSMYRLHAANVDKYITFGALPSKQNSNPADNAEESSLNKNIFFTRELIDSCYFNVLNAISMIYSGEEVYPTLLGSRESNLSKAYCGFETYTHNLEDISDKRAECQWSSHVSKMFEPLMLDLTSEDGKGSTKTLCSKECVVIANRNSNHLISTIFNLR